ncbi:hypothetical protein [Nocardioides sp. YIM 152588]|uniref:hypothetical protein n=1 Tax=Nocardioides sp. YIM 152588 TaxID=3158259 RepID=UPI0032E4CCBF
MSDMTRWDDDDELVAALREARAGAVTDADREAARAAFAWRTIDEELLQLSHDSALEEAVLVRGDGEDAPRVLGFEGADFSLELEVDGDTLIGQVVPGRRCEVAVVTPGGATRSSTDASGLFSLAAPDRRPIRITVSDAGRTVSTEWLTL